MENYSNIDELLAGGGVSVDNSSDELSNSVSDVPEQGDDYEMEAEVYADDAQDQDTPDDHDGLQNSGDDNSFEEDEYGNKTAKLSKNMQKRLERQAESLKRKYEAELQAVRDSVIQDHYSPEQREKIEQRRGDPDADWERDLSNFIERTVSNISTKQEQAAREAREHKIQQDFERKLVDGMNRFGDFRDVISALPCDISNPMALATRGMDDPAAFLYAAAKRQPQELERISRMADPYAQMTEMGKLEERMRRNKQTTQAPRPLGKVSEDATMPHEKKKKEETIEDLIANSDKKRLSQRKAMYRVR